jgi:hypothetical protein
MTPSKYVVTLQSSVSSHAMIHNTKYTHIQQSQEMLHQALQLYNPLIATKLTSKLNHWINTHQTMVKSSNLPNKWKITGLADLFLDYHTKTSIIPSINMFDGKNKEGGYAKNNSKRYSLRNKKQRVCCKMAGHSIGEQHMWQNTQRQIRKLTRLTREITTNRIVRSSSTE